MVVPSDVSGLEEDRMGQRARFCSMCSLHPVSSDSKTSLHSPGRRPCCVGRDCLIGSRVHMWPRWSVAYPDCVLTVSSCGSYVAFGVLLYSVYGVKL